MPKRRAFVVVIDGLGVGAMPDAPDYNDGPDCNTMARIDAVTPDLSLPTLEKLGLGNILPLSRVPAQQTPLAQVTKLAERSKGKDTTTGHWEMMGMVLSQPFPTYPEGFPDELVRAFIEETGCGGILGNKPASGTAILEELGEEHLKTGHPIVYTSADSVWQIAAHVSVTPIETLYQWCETAREIMRGEHEVSRVIARPFEGDSPATFKRIGHARHDYAVAPPREGNLLLTMLETGAQTIGIGKIHDIFCGEGITHSIKSRDNADGLRILSELLTQKTPLADYKVMQDATDAEEKQLIFVNLVETDMNFGHRRDVLGYARALEKIDTALADFMAQMEDGDLLILTGDHGCDPGAPGSDHTREYVPYLAYSPGLAGGTLSVQSGFDVVGRACVNWLNGEAVEAVYQPN